MEFVRFFSSYDPIEIEIVKSLLLEEDIPHFVKDMSISPYPFTFSEKSIFVRKDKFLLATKIVEKAFSDGYIENR